MFGSPALRYFSHETGIASMFCAVHSWASSQLWLTLSPYSCSSALIWLDSMHSCSSVKIILHVDMWLNPDDCILYIWPSVCVSFLLFNIFLDSVDLGVWYFSCASLNEQWSIAEKLMTTGTESYLLRNHRNRPFLPFTYHGKSVVVWFEINPIEPIWVGSLHDKPGSETHSRTCLRFKKV